MFKLLLVAVLLGLAAADRDAVVVSEEHITADAEGNYSHSFETSNGISAQESGNPDGVSGANQWITDNGQQYKTTYTADERGYQPMGDHLPTPPPIPEYILRAQEYINSHPPQLHNPFAFPTLE